MIEEQSKEYFVERLQKCMAGAHAIIYFLTK